VWLKAAVIAGIGFLMRHNRLKSEINALAAQASRARDRLRPDSDEQLRQLDKRLAEARQNREVLSKMLVDLSSRKPSPMLGAAS
jgi:predicted  nucleic acid-binding Zn-ribbon protein